MTPGRWTGAALLATLLVAAAALPARAQEGARVRVLSGEHGGFTRLAMVLPEAPRWQFGRIDDGYGLRIAEPADIAFDIAEVWNLIDRRRIAALTPITGGLNIALGCPCHAEAFVDGERVLVIDIRPGPPPGESPFEATLLPLATAAGANPPEPPATAASPVATPEATPEAAAAVAPGLQARTTADGRLVSHSAGGQLRAPTTAPPPTMRLPHERFATVLGPVTLPRGTNADSPPPPSASTEPPMPDPSRPEPPQPAPTGGGGNPPVAEIGALDPRILEAQEDLLRGLGEAAARGAIEIERPLQRFAAEVQADPVAQPSPVPPLHLGNGAEGQLLIRDDATMPRPGSTADGRACLTDAALDLAAWGHRETLNDDLSAGRRNLLGEFDRPDPAALLGLVRLYLHAGFGAEAKNLLDAFAPPEAEAAAGPSGPAASALAELDALGPAYRAIADLLDGRPAGSAKGAFAGMAVCDSHAALWAVLAEGRIEPGKPLAMPAVLRAFSALPVHLRGALGPPLVSILIEGGAQDAVVTLQAMLARAPDGTGEALGLMVARLDLAAGRTEAGEAALGAIVTANSPLSVAALGDLVDSVVARGSRIDPDMMLMLEALAREEGGGPEAPALIRALALARAASGDAEGAFAAAAGAQDAPAVTTRVWEVLANGPDAAALLQPALGQAQTGAPPALPETIRLAVARRLLGLGFAREAEVWIDGSTTAGARLTRAEARLRLADPAGALTELEGLDPGAEPEAEAEAALRGRALRLAGAPVEAARALMAAGEAEAAQRALLEARAWPEVAAGPDPALATPIASLIAPPPAAMPEATIPNAPVEGMLAAGRDILAGASAQRRAAEALVLSVAPPDG